MRLESGPAAYDRNYYAAFLLLCVGLGAYFCYDYAVGYAKRNFETAKRRLTTLVDRKDIPDTLPETPTKPIFDALVDTRPTTRDALYERLGQPFTTKQEGNRTFEYFVSVYGMASVTITGNRVDPKSLDWKKWEKTKEEIDHQLYYALFTFAVGLYVLYRVYKAATLRVLIDDEGMVYARRRILFDSMTRLCDYNRKGWVDLYYQHGPEERKLRIDNQKVRKFDEIVDALCQAKGFEDPRQAAEEPEAARETEASDQPPEPTDTPDKPADATEKPPDDTPGTK